MVGILPQGFSLTRRMFRTGVAPNGTRDGLIIGWHWPPHSLHLTRARFAVLRVAAGGRRDEGAAGERGGAGEGDVGRVAVLAGEREVLAQRVKSD